MPVFVACPSCHVELNVPEDFLGRKVRCATCSTVFEARESQPGPQPPSNPAAEERFSDRPVAGDQERDHERWGDRLAPGQPPRPADDNPPPRNDDDYRDERRWIRRDVLPHRGSTIMTLGIISIVGGTVGAVVCGLFSGLVGIGLGITTIVMGRGDLRQIDEGTMDPDGRGQTKAGIICGIVGIVCGTLILLACGAYLVFIMFFAMNQP
jgi:predicted Zn finger-like uncharacterized protein